MKLLQAFETPIDFLPESCQSLALRWDDLMSAVSEHHPLTRRKLSQAQALLASGRSAETLSILRELNTLHPQPLLLHWLGLVSAATNDWEAARNWLLKEQQQLPIEDAWSRAINAYELGRLALQQDRLLEAISFLRTSILQARYARDGVYEGRARHLLGLLAVRRQQPEIARDYFATAREAFLRAGDLQAAARMSGLIDGN